MSPSPVDSGRRLSARSAGPLPPGPGAKPAGLCRARLCAAARTPARAASRRRAMPLTPIRRTPSAGLRRPTPGARLDVPPRCGARSVTAAVRCFLGGCSFRVARGVALPRYGFGRFGRPARFFGEQPGRAAAELAFRPAADLHGPRFRGRAVDAAAAASGAMDRCPAARSPAAASPRFPEVRVPLRVAFSRTRSKGVAAWSGLAGILNPCRMEVLQACRLAVLQGLGPRL